MECEKMETEKNKQKIKVLKIELEPVNLNFIKIKIKGKTPLIMDRFSEETQNKILAKQSGVSKSNKKMVRNTETEIAEARHVTSDGQIGFPVNGFKRGMMECTSFVGDKFFSKKLIQGAVKIVNAVEGLVPITYENETTLRHNIGHNVKF